MCSLAAEKGTQCEGRLKKRYKGRGAIILDLGDVLDPAQARRSAAEVAPSFYGNKKQAEDKLTDLLGAVQTMLLRRSVETDARAMADAVDRPWSSRPFAPATFTRYHGIVQNHLLKAQIAGLVLQKVAGLTWKPITRAYPRGAVPSITRFLRRALRKAVKDKLLTVNPAVDLDHAPRRPKSRAAGIPGATAGPQSRRSVRDRREGGRPAGGGALRPGARQRAPARTSSAVCCGRT